MAYNYYQVQYVDEELNQVDYVSLICRTCQRNIKAR